MLAALYGAFFSKKSEIWAVVYAQNIPVASLLPYDLLVLDRDAHPPLALLKDGKRIVLGYMSMGEAEISRQNYDNVSALGVETNPIPEWNGNPLIDVRKPQWRQYVLNTLIPDILKQGFDGVMIDTVDSLVWLEQKEPVRYAGLQRATIALIKEIRAKFPKIYIMMNRGFDVLPDVGGDIDMLLAESTYTGQSASTHQPEMIPLETHVDYIMQLKVAQKRFRHLKIYTLDYWPPSDVATIQSIYKKQRSNGFIPYVSTMGLQEIVAEPKQ